MVWGVVSGAVGADVRAGAAALRWRPATKSVPLRGATEFFARALLRAVCVCAGADAAVVPRLPGQHHRGAQPLREPLLCLQRHHRAGGWGFRPLGVALWGGRARGVRLVAAAAATMRQQGVRRAPALATLPDCSCIVTSASARAGRDPPSDSLACGSHAPADGRGRPGGGGAGAAGAQVDAGLQGVPRGPGQAREQGGGARARRRHGISL